MTEPDKPRREKLRDRLKTEMADEATPRPERARRVARLRAKAVKDAYDEVKKKGPLRIGKVDIGHLEHDGIGVDIWLGEKRDGPPDFRINTPPTLVKDAAGDIELPERPGRYREDPLAAVAAVIESLRSQGQKGRRL